MATEVRPLSERTRAYLARKAAIARELHLARHNSTGRKQLEAQLAALTAEELRAELAGRPAAASAAPPAADDPYGGRTPYWVEK